MTRPQTYRTHYFAPGVIDHQRTRMDRRRLAAKWARRVAAVMAATAASAYAYVYLYVGGHWL